MVDRKWSSFSLEGGDLLGRRYSARVYLLGLIAAAIVPVWLFAAYVLVSFALSQQTLYREQSVQLARQAATVVDGELRDMLVRIDGLARSAAFENGDLAKLHAEARRLVSGTDQVVALRDLAQKQVFNSGVEYGLALPPASTLTSEEIAGLGDQEPRVSGVLAGPAAAEPRVEVIRPIALKGGTRALLSISAPTSAFHQVLSSSVPDGWVVGVADRQGVYVTRSARHEEVTGKPGLPEYLGKAVGQSGSFTAANQFGDTLLAGYYRSSFSGWLYAANVPLQTVEAPLWRSLSSVLGIGAVALAISLALAYYVGKLLTGETRKLAAQAVSLGSSRSVTPVETRLSEFALISDALVEAHDTVRERTSELEAVLDTVPVGVWFTYDTTGRQVIRNRYATELMGLPSSDAKPFGSRDPVIDTVALKDGQVVAREDRPLTKAMRGEHTDHEEFLYRLPGGAELILSISARPVLDADDKVRGAVQISLDITERKRAEAQRRLLTKELDHRVKNNLAIVQALVQQTMRSSDTVEQASLALGGRLAALAQAQEMLTQAEWLESGVRKTIETTLLAQTTADRITLDGPELALPSSQVMAVTLAMHELTTNAVKYGSLSNETGTINVSWKVSERKEKSELVIRWVERGGPAVEKPTRRGFGSRLLERITGAEGGEVERLFEPEGFSCVVRLPATG